jgi:hypothetical protein
MRSFLTILTFLVTTPTFSQSLSDKYLHYKTDYYWDTTLYKSEQAYYYEVTDGKITERGYPVLQNLFTKIISDSPVVTKDTFETRTWSRHPYKYIKKGSDIYLQYFDLGKRKLRLNKEYCLTGSDTIKWLADKYSLDNKDGIYVSGYSTYQGEEMVEINGRQFKAYHFSENHPAGSFDARSYVKDVFLEQKSLVPIKFVTIYYDDKTGQKDLYSATTILSSSGSALPDYTGKTPEDLVLYEDRNLIWTEQQKQAFLKLFKSGQYADCLLKKLDGHISFFHFEQNMYFRNLVRSRQCE